LRRFGSAHEFRALMAAGARPSPKRGGANPAANFSNWPCNVALILSANLFVTHWRDVGSRKLIVFSWRIWLTRKPVEQTQLVRRFKGSWFPIALFSLAGRANHVRACYGTKVLLVTKHRSGIMLQDAA